MELGELSESLGVGGKRTSALSSEFCTVQALKGLNNLSNLRSSEVSTFQGIYYMAVNGNAIHTRVKCPLKRDVHISEVRNSRIPL